MGSHKAPGVQRNPHNTIRSAWQLNTPHHLTSDTTAYDGISRVLRMSFMPGFFWLIRGVDFCPNSPPITMFHVADTSALAPPGKTHFRMPPLRICLWDPARSGSSTPSSHTPPEHLTKIISTTIRNTRTHVVPNAAVNSGQRMRWKRSSVCSQLLY